MITMKKINGRLELDNDRPHWDSNTFLLYKKILFYFLYFNNQLE